MIICAGVDIVRSREFHCESVGVSRLKFWMISNPPSGSIEVDHVAKFKKKIFYDYFS